LERVDLQVRLREDASKRRLKEMRRHGMIPGSVYGKGKATLSLEVGLSQLAEALNTDAGIHAIMDLQIQGKQRTERDTAVVKNIQRDPITRKIQHVDFQRVELSDVVITPVIIDILGEPAGVKEGGILEQVLTEIDIKSRADHIPPKLEVDISKLAIGDILHASDIPLPEGVELAIKPDSVIAVVRPPHIHAEPVEEEIRGEEEAVPEESAVPPAAEIE